MYCIVDTDKPFDQASAVEVSTIQMVDTAR